MNANETTIPPAHELRLCRGLVCELGGARGLAAELPALVAGDLAFAHTPCMGLCDRAPAARLGDNIIAPASCERVGAALAAHEETTAAASLLRYEDYASYRAGGGYRLLEQCTSGMRSPDAVFRQLDEAGLRTPAGGALSAHWRLRRTSASSRTLLLAAGTGAAGDFRGRALLERWPHRVLEGALVAAWACGCERIELALCPASAMLQDIVGAEVETLKLQLPIASLQRIELTAGSPQPAAVGEPGLDVFLQLREALETDAAALAAQGRRGLKGRRVLAVSGHVRQPGLKFVPAGITLAELVDEFSGGMTPGHTLAGCVAGRVLPLSLAHTLLLEEAAVAARGGSMATGAVIVLSNRDDLTRVRAALSAQK